MEREQVIANFKKTIPTFEIESDKCPICSSNKYSILSNKDRYGFNLPYGCCITCGLIQSIYKYKLKNYITFYNNFYGPIYKNEIFSINKNKEINEKSFLSRKKIGKTLYDYTFDFITLKPNSKILEIGCGLGGIISYFYDKGHNVKGIDLKEQDINFAKSKGLNVEKKTLENIKQSEKFDFIILMRSLEHIHDPLSFIKLLKSKLNDGGILFISVPSLDSLFHTADIKKMNLQSQLHFAHVYFFSKETLKNLMSICGFKNIHMNHYINSLWIKSDKTSPSLKGNKKVLFLLFYLKNFKFIIRYNNLIKMIILYITKNGFIKTFRKILSVFRKNQKN